MTLDQIITALKQAELPPTEALRAAMPQAATLAPEVYRALDAFCRGVCLQPSDQRLLMYGLHVLAAARHEGLWAKLIDLARAPGDELAALFEDQADLCLTRMMLSVWDGDTAALLHLIEHADLDETAKWALFDVLARMTFDDRIPRERTTDFLVRFELEGLADDDSGTWFGWEAAVTRLGLVELRPAIERVWTRLAYAEHDDDDHAESITQLMQCAAAPRDPAAFDEALVTPINDPVEALAWMLESHREFQALREELGLTTPNPLIENDPGLRIRPAADEMAWLDLFLSSRQVSPTTMSLEMLDGYLTAIVIGPGEAPPSDYLQLIWGEDGEQPAWHGNEQESYVLGLLQRQFDAIAARRNANAPQIPFVMSSGDETDGGGEWAEGFMIGIDLRSQAWQPLLDDRRGSEDLQAIVALTGEDNELFEGMLSAAERDGIIDRLPHILQRIAAFWRDPAGGYSRQQPVRVTKVGRNDPCPCGSGKKYKKCCAQSPPSTVH